MTYPASAATGFTGARPVKPAPRLSPRPRLAETGEPAPALNARAVASAAPVAAQAARPSPFGEARIRRTTPALWA